MIQCEIILTGNELLVGKIADTNGKWIIDQIVPLGIQVSQITIIPDNLEIISSTFRSALDRKPNYIFVSGGLGPTFDDMTILGISKGLYTPLNLIENKQSVLMMKERYETRYPDLSFDKLIQERPYLLKMAMMPEGCISLSNSEGTAPGVRFPPSITNGYTTIVAMPGIPKELYSIFSLHILPELQQISSDQHFYQGGFVFQNIGESKFTQKVYELKDQYPSLWIKTHPRKSDLGHWELELHITATGGESDVFDKLKEVYALLKQHVIQSHGIIVNENLPNRS
ncbi:hypothetical protein WKT22_01636 [Candidatus Lokiarchaeum ossiferum]